MTKSRLFFTAVMKFLMGVSAVAILLFLPAGTWNYRNGLIFSTVLFVPMFIFGIFLIFKNPALLEKRLKAREKENTQKTVIGISALMFIGCFVLAGLDFRFGWTHVSDAVVYIGAGIFLVAYALNAEVMRENTYLSRVVEIQENQKVIDTGLYSVVRHPMYFAVLLLFMSMPLILGSWISLICMLPLPFVLAARIRNEEKVLETGLSGYAEYKQKVRYRLFPLIW